jgi:hypothetical protein
MPPYTSRTDASILEQCQREIRPQREERAMGEVDDAKQAENDRKPDRNQHIQAAKNQPARDLGQDDI